MRTVTVFLVLIFSMIGLFANEANETINQIIEKNDKIQNYSADVLITVDVDFINIDDRKAKLTFKKPNQFNIESEGFTMLPKNGSEMEYISLLKDDHTAIKDRKESYNSKELQVYKIIPSNSENTDIILAELWIDEQELRVYKLNAFTKNNGNYSADFEYSNNPYDLPNKLTLEFNIKNPNIPNYMTGEMKSTGKQLPEGNTKGKVIFYYSNYKVNQ